MKKTILLTVIMTFFGAFLIFGIPSTANGQTYLRKVVRNGRVSYVRVRKPSYYRRHRNRINVAAGTAGGAVLGGLIGGRKGALVGAGVGAGSSAMYTYVWNKKKRKYVKVRRHRTYRRL